MARPTRFIYGLVTDAHPYVRYVGQTGNWRRRLSAHRHVASTPPTPKGPLVNKWLREEHAAGRRVRMALLSIVFSEDADTKERAAIARIRGNGLTLLNVAAGGKGVAGVTWSDERKAAFILRRTGETRSPETRARLAAHLSRVRPQKGVPVGPFTDEHRANIKKAQIARFARKKEMSNESQR